MEFRLILTLNGYYDRHSIYDHIDQIALPSHSEEVHHLLTFAFEVADHQHSKLVLVLHFVVDSQVEQLFDLMMMPLLHSDALHLGSTLNAVNNKQYSISN